MRRSRHPAQDGYGAGGSCPTALRLPDLGYRGLREEPVGWIRHLGRHPAQDGYGAGGSCPAALRLPGRGVGFRGAFR
ncbi:hypothetical protein CS912_14190 (plasmid) [Klebsiella variicola]|nr:hypothetical protein [Klebsiella variicola]PHZ93157.1 hypothetical protein CS911_21035 [Klebsiella variicola]PIA10129.1 hypothetical protein CS912_14190 [Klebsiella variicola]